MHAIPSLFGYAKTADLAAYLASPPSIGGTAAAAGAFTTLSASSTVSGTGFSTYLASPPAIGGTAAAAISGTTITATTGFVAPAGAAAAYGFSGTTDKFYRSGASTFRFSFAGVDAYSFQASAVTLSAGMPLFWGSSGVSSPDTAMVRASANSLLFGLGSATTTSRTEINKTTTGIANAAATTVLTITIPNAAHSASILVRVTGSLGAGGAIGANEATATNCYIVTVTRTAGVNAVATISAAFGAAASAVAGAATVTCTAALAAVSGAVGATNTIDIQVTISRSGGSSANHTCLSHASLMNANATGITIA